MNIKRPLMPAFLKKAEQQLLLNKPGIWSTRAYLVMFYGLLFIIVLAAICFLEPSDLRSYSNTGEWIGFVSIITIIGLTLWLIYLVRFNLFKKYGLIHPLYMLVTFILYFVSAGIIVLFTYVQPVVESVRANMAYGDEEIVNDVNAINTKVCQLEYSSFQLPWKADTVIFIKSKPQYQRRNNYPIDETTADVDVPARGGRYRRLDTSESNLRDAGIDSLVKLNDSLNIMFTTPDYALINAYGADSYTRNKFLRSIDLYNRVIKPKQGAINREQITRELNSVLHKYEYHIREYTRYQYEGGDSPQDKARRRYHLYQIEDNISNIVAKKYRWSDIYLPIYGRLFYYFTLGITLLLFIFRHSTTRTFFLSLLTALLLTIFTAFALSFSHAGDQSFFLWLTIYWLLFFFGSLSAWFSEKRNMLTGIAINLFVLLTPILPLIIVGWYYTWKEDLAREQLKLVVYPAINPYLYAEVGGGLLLLILLATYLQKTYRRWYALPQE